MKILEIGSALHDWGGIERYLAYLCQGMRDRGHDVWATVPPGSPLEKRLGLNGQSTAHRVPIDLRRQFQFSRVAAYLRLFRGSKFDVVNAHYSPDYIVPAIAARLARQPCRVLTRHVVLTWSPMKVRRYTRLFTHFIGVSEAVKARLVDSGIPADRVEVAKPGCPALQPTLPPEAVRQALAISGFAVGSFGRLVEEKGISTLMEAARSFSSETIHLFGDGPLRTKLIPKPAGLRVHGRLEDVANEMNAMDVIAIPSLWEEAFGYAAVEAMSLGKPVIATRSGGLPELIKDGENGFLIEKRDAAALVKAIEALRADPALCAKMGQAARELHQSEYTVEKFAERVEAAYERAIECTPR